MGGVAVYKDGRILPCRHKEGEKLTVYSYDGGVVDSDGNFVEASMLHEQPCSVGGAYAATFKRERGKAIYIGFLLSEWGNCLTDGLKKLWFLRTDEGRKLIGQGAKVVFVTMHNAALPAHQAELWRLAGFESSTWMHITEPTSFGEVVVPDNSFVARPDEERLFDERFVEVINCIKRKAVEEMSGSMDIVQNIYFTRTKLRRSKDTNEKSIERLFRHLGYTIIAPEKLSIKRQIFLWANATNVAATEGSIAHSSMFMRKGSNLAVLKKADYVNGYQEAANKIAGVNTTYIKAHHSTCVSKAMPWAGPFYLCVTAELQEWAGVEMRNSPYLLRPSYWLYLIRNLKLLHSLKTCLYMFKLRLSGEK